MSQELRPSMVYLGDSVYIEIENGMIKLTTQNFGPNPDNTIYLDEATIYNFINFLKSKNLIEGSL